MAWRFWPVVDFILVATFETEVRSEGSRLCEQGAKASARGNYKLAVNLISLCIKNGQLKTRPLAKLITTVGPRSLALIATSPPPSIGMRLHMDLAYDSRALVLAKIEKHGLAIVDYGRAIRFNENNASLY